MQHSSVVRILLTLCFLGLAFPAVAQRARIELVDRIIAVVNNDVITQFEFNERLRVVQRQLEGQGIKMPPRDILEKQLLERVINEKVQLQFAAETGIRIDDATLDRALGRIAEGNRMSLDSFRQALEKDGVSFAKFREDIRNEIILTRVKEREADNRVTVTEGEVEHFFANQAAHDNDTEYNIGHILIQVPERASPEQIQARKARAEQALNELKKGADFAQVSASFSDAQNALQGGELGWRSASRLPQLFSDALNTLQPGQFSPLLRSPNGFHLLKLIDKRGRDVPLVVTQTHARHILIKTNELISEADAKRRLTELKERLDNNAANFAELARLHSEDGSAAKGGDLGWLSPGDTVPEFEKAMDALAVNAVSQPILSPFGWHLIQVLERRREDVTQEKQKLKARMEIRERKADEAYQEFVRQLRDRAYVEYRSDDR